jgi:sporulation protein YlmC with PRC-barrel domain
MTKRMSLACAASLLMAGTALAQTGTAPADTSAPTMSAPALNAGASASSSASNGKFVTEQKTGEFRVSKFVGLNVYGADNQKIGDVNEILIDVSGNAQAAVIGVGGFLGIGEKNVAVPFSSLTWSNEPVHSNATAASAPNGSVAAPATTAASTTAPGTMGTAGTSSAADTNVTGSTSPARSPAETAAANGYPDHAVLSMTKADLQNAPEFKYANQMQSNGAAAKK